MFRRLYYSLFKPKRIALFIKDRLYLSMLYALFFVLLFTIPTIVSYSVSNNNISLTSFNAMVSDIPTDSNAKIENYIFTTDKVFSVTVDEVVYDFGTTKDVSQSNSLTVVFSESNVIFYQYTYQVATASYQSLGFSNIDFNVLTTDSANYTSLQNAMNTIYNTYYRYSNYTYAISAIFNAILKDIILTGIIFLIITMAAPILKPSFRLNISIYSLSWYYILMFFQNALGMSYIYIIGIVLAFFFARKALSSIKIVPMNRG